MSAITPLTDSSGDAIDDAPDDGGNALRDDKERPLGWQRSAILACVIGFIPEVAIAIEFCQGPVRVTCVVDGDTVWINGEKIRLADIDAPEPRGACVAERVLAARAAGRLAELLDDGDYVIERSGHDAYGRTLATISTGGRSVGAILVEEGLARPWTGRRESWC